MFYILLLISNMFSYEYDYIYRTARPVGMGGAFTAVSDDINALFYNPAGLNKVKENEIILFNPQFSADYNTFKLANDVSGIIKGDDMLDSMMGYLGSNLNFNLSLGVPYWLRKNFAVAVILPNIKSYMMLRREVATEAVLDTVADAGVAAGYSRSFLEDKLAVGVSGKFITRGVGHYNPDAQEIYAIKEGEQDAPSFDEVARFAGGVDFDLGALYTFNRVLFFVPTVGLSINNILDSDFPINFKGTEGNVADSPYTSLQRSINLGSKFELDDLWLVRKWIVAFDINHILAGGSAFKKVHLGTEAWLLDFFGFRTGLNQGYLTLGLSFDVPFCMIDLYTYGEEMGDSAGSRENRKFGIQVAVGF